MSKEGRNRYLEWLENEASGVSRRDFLKASMLAGLGAAGLSLVGCAPPEPPEEEPEPIDDPGPAPGEGEVIVCSWGGSFQEIQREHIFDPFEEETGIRVVDVSQPDNARLKAMVDSDNVEWDVLTTSYNSFLELGPNYFTPIDYGIYPDDQLDGLMEGSKLEYGVGSIIFAVVNTYRTDVFPTGEHPKNWSEFFDADRFPGPRTLYASGGMPGHTLEHALMADGVPMDELYPLDVDRAFAVLDRIKPHVVTWWESGAIPVQMLADEEVVLATTYNGRAQALIDDGVPIAIEWNQGTMNQDLWYIPAKRPNPDSAQRFVQFATRGDVQGRFSEYYAYGPSNLHAYDHMSPERAAIMPTNPDLVKQMVFRNDDWWAPRRTELVERFAEWRLQ